MLVGAGGKSTVQVGKDGVLLVDTKLAAQADKLIAAIRKISDKPIRYIINTSADADLTGGNETAVERRPHDHRWQRRRVQRRIPRDHGGV